LAGELLAAVAFVLRVPDVLSGAAGEETGDVYGLEVVVSVCVAGVLVRVPLV
jgi:hypothetical protein